jgi:rhodanese-related sulfurtransferase
MKFSMLVFSLALVLSIASLANQSFAQTQQSELVRVIYSGAFLVDVRTPQEFAEGSVNGAVNIPHDQIQQQISKFRGKKSIVVFCRSGSRSNQAKAILESNQIKNIFNGGSWMNIKSIVGK